jgi:dihydropteroate synthase
MSYHELGAGALLQNFITADMDVAKCLYIRPLSPYRNGQISIPLYEVIFRFENGQSRHQVAHQQILDWAQDESDTVYEHVLNLLGRLKEPVSTFAGMNITSNAMIMGIVNVTPDSFSDGGDHNQTEAAIDHGRLLMQQGADILDIGGESTRPGAEPVPHDEEISRVVPVIKALKAEGAIISIDSRHAVVMEAALDAGADIINDVTALEGDGALELAVKRNVPVMIMHMQGEPQTMQSNPDYDDCVLDIYDYLQDRINQCVAGGIKLENICVDPGIGFGKTLDHNMDLMNQLGIYHGLGCAILLGASRKSFISHICGDVAPKDRLAGSLAAALKGADAGAQFIRVHDVLETKQALDVWRA